MENTKKRLQLGFQYNEYKNLEALQEFSGHSTKAGVIRAALESYGEALKCNTEGGKVVFHTRDNRENIPFLMVGSGKNVRCGSKRN
jgi:hypothetical protein